MSASREKKQRRSAGPDQKALRAQQEQAARKRKTVIYSVIAAVVVVLVAALFVWRSGFFQSRAAAATVGDETLTTAELSYYYQQARQFYAAYGLYVGFDTSKSDDEQIYSAEDNKTYRDYFLETALATAQKHLAQANAATAAGHTAAEVQKTVDAYVSNAKAQASASGVSYAAYLRLAYGSYMTPAAYEKLTTRALLADLAAEDKYDELFDGYQQSDLDAYYAEHKDDLDTFEYSYLYFPMGDVDTKDKDGNDLPEDEVKKLEEEALAKAKEKADEALEALEDEATVASLISKYSLDSTADHAKVVGSSAITPAGIREDLLKLDVDKGSLVEAEKGYYVIVFHGRSRAEDPTRDVLHILARAQATTDGDGKWVAPTDEAWAAAKERIDAIKAEYDAGTQGRDAFEALAKDRSDDSGSAAKGGLIPRIAEDSLYVPEFMDWIWPVEGAHPQGETGIVQHNGTVGSTGNEYWGYHMIFYVGENEPVWKGTARDALANAATESWIEELVAGYPAAALSGANYLGK